MPCLHVVSKERIRMPQNKPGSVIEQLQVFRNSRRPAVQSEALTLAYADLNELVSQAVTRLLDADIGAGDRVLIRMPNAAEHIIGVLAVLAAGAIAVPVDADIGANRLRDVIHQTSPRLCLVCAESDAPALLPTMRLGINPVSMALTCLLAGSAAEQKPSDVADKRLAFIRFTSGTTGVAKGVMIGHAQQVWTARTLSEHFSLDAGHRELMLVSMALSGGWQRVAATLYGGGCVILGQKPLSVGDMLDELVRFEATGFFTPPPLVRMLLASPADRVRSALQGCRTIEIGSAAVTADELQALTRLLPATRVYVHYGLTECSRAVILDSLTYPDRLATVGKPAPGVELKIVDDQGQSLPSETSGQILVRGPQLASGYWQQPELTRERFIDGWLQTGDYGMLDDAGFLMLRGRHDDMINCGGHCYFPNEVELALGTPEGVEQYLVTGVPDPRGVLQEVPWAFVVPVSPDSWSPGQFLRQARASLPAHMVPRQVVVVPRLALTASGKPDRRETAKLYAGNAKIPRT